jgi:hypothetical protein
MASLEDVKRYARMHVGDDQEGLEARIAKEFEMSREEAAKVVASLADETGMGEPALNTGGLANPPLMAGAVAGTGVGGNPAVGVIAASEVAHEADRDSMARRTDQGVIGREGERPDAEDERD